MQMRDLRAYCAARGFTIIREYIDIGQSGAKDSRPELNELMADARKRTVIRFAPAQDDESWPTCVSMRWLSERSFHEAHQLFGWGHIGSVRGAGLAG
jgi:hypothetical protein